MKDERSSEEEAKALKLEASTKAWCFVGESAGPVLRYRPGFRALREIQYYQRSTELLIAKTCFQKLVRDMVSRISDPERGGVRFESQALLALQEAGEQYLVGLFEDASFCAVHGRRVTLQPRDLHLSNRMRGVQPVMRGGGRGTA